MKIQTFQQFQDFIDLFLLFWNNLETSSLKNKIETSSLIEAVLM
jgi:hypothetical protein